MAVQAMGTTTASREMLAGFMATLQAEGMSPRHREAHRCAVDRLAEYMRPRDASDATPGDVRGFLAYLGELGVSPQSQGVYRDVLARWLDYLAAIAEQSGFDRGGDEAPLLATPGVDADTQASVVTGATRLDEESHPDHDQTWPLTRSAQPPALGEAAFPPPRAVARSTGFEPVAAPASPTAFADVEPAAWVAPASPAFGTAPQPDVEDDWLSAPVATAPAVALIPAVSAFALPPASAQGLGTTLPTNSGLSDDAFAAASAPFEPPAAEGRRHILARLPAELPSMPPIGGAAPKVGQGAFDRECESVALASAPEYRDGQVTALGDDGGEAEHRKAQARPATTRRLTLDDTSPAWALKYRGVERSDLGLAAIRDMTLAGKLGPDAMIRRPGGEWMRAGHFAPLKSIFHDQAEMLTATGRLQPGASAPGPVASAVRAWAGGALGGLAGGVAWWLVTIVVGSEWAPATLLGGLLAGACASMLCGGRAASRMHAGFTGTALGVVLGRYLVYATIASGINAVRAAEVTGLGAFLVSSLWSAAGAWALGGILLGGLVAKLMGRRG